MADGRNVPSLETRVVVREWWLTSVSRFERGRGGGWQKTPPRDAKSEGGGGEHNKRNDEGEAPPRRVETV